MANILIRNILSQESLLYTRVSQNLMTRYYEIEHRGRKSYQNIPLIHHRFSQWDVGHSVPRGRSPKERSMLRNGTILLIDQCDAGAWAVFPIANRVHLNTVSLDTSLQILSVSVSVFTFLEVATALSCIIIYPYRILMNVDTKRIIRIRKADTRILRTRL